MYFPIQYITVGWTPPVLNPEEEIALGEKVSRLGKAHFRREFRRKSMRHQASAEEIAASETFRNRPKWYRAFCIALFACIVIGASIVAPAILLAVFPITAFILLMYFGSLGIAVLRYDRWLARCLARFHESQDSGHITSSLTTQAQLFKTYDEIAASYNLLNTAEGISPATKTCSFEYKLTLTKRPYEVIVRHLTMVVEVWERRIHTIYFWKVDGSDIDDDEAEELMLQNSDGATWGKNPVQPQFFFRSDQKAVASYRSGRKDFSIAGRDLLSARAKAVEESKSS